MSTRLPVKDPAESRVVTFDFSKEATSVSSPACTCTVYWPAAGDPSPAAVLSGQPQVNGSNPAQVFQLVTGGLDVNDYALRCVALDQNGYPVVVAAILPVRKQPA